MLIASDGRSFYYGKILIFPTVLGELRVDVILRRAPKISMQSLELHELQLVLSCREVVPHPFHIAWVKAGAEKLCYYLFKSIKIDGLVGEPGHIPKCLSC
jgi:hypothetical protein